MKRGVPVNVLANGRRVYFTTTIVQKALGHWDQWLLIHNDTDREVFLKLCRWLLTHQDEHGGWLVWREVGLSLPSLYSVMTHVECISALVRAWKLTKTPSSRRVQDGPWISCADLYKGEVR